MPVSEDVMELARLHEYLPPIHTLWSYDPEGEHDDPLMVVRVVLYGVTSGYRTVYTMRWFRKGLPLKTCERLEDAFAETDGMRMAHFDDMVASGILRPFDEDCA